MPSDYNRFENDCEGCSCYTGNLKEDEIFDPDNECTLGHDVEANTGCDDVDSLSLYNSKCDAKDELIDRRCE
jgi:hypothetical protein